MSNLELSRTVWVITVRDESEGLEADNLVASVFESEASASKALHMIRSDEEKLDFVQYFIEEVPMFLDIDVRKVET